MDVGALGYLDISQVNTDVGQTKRLGSNESEVEKLFESILIQVLSQTTGIGDTSNDGALGLNGPWKNLVYVTLNEALTDGNKMGIGKLLSDSMYNRQHEGI